MFRVFLTAYVSLVMLAGPSVCCCTTTRAVVDCFAGNVTETPAEDRPCCCGHQATRDDARAETKAASDESGSPSAPDEEHECPCRKNKTHAVGETREQVADLSQVRSIVLAPLAVTSSVTRNVDVIVVGENAQVPNRASHFGTASEFLRALRTYLI